MRRYLKKALADIGSNRFLNLITIVTISLSILVVSLFLLFFENASRVIEGRHQGGRAMVYLEPAFSEKMLPELEARIKSLEKVEDVTFVSKSQALDRLKKQMAGHTKFLDTLKENPLPHALEIRINAHGSFDQTVYVAQKIEAMEMVESVEYGQGWLARFYKIFKLFRITGYAMCSLFLLIALFITANTVRLAFYSRQTEIEIMHMVGATSGFIKTPFYVQGLIQGFLGGIMGLLILYTAFLTVSSGISQSLGMYVYLDIRFLSFKAMGLVIFSSTFLGWFGCYLSLRQILR
ncbi:MAG: permease-like cell division protein FtsX [Desulfotignum sp.]|nr:permease-like cell division protein FtsX [Desulfotignum sp.]